jgi:class 3 adenylate cyclase/tetratricopeptide (TPR) repeat protein
VSASVTATFVFTDLVDSTATAARLGPEAAEGLRQTHFRLLRSAIGASGGIEVKNLGDGLMVMYSSPSRALSGAVGMQQAIDHHNRSDGEPLGVRIGVSAGEAVEDDDDYFGDPVVEAARLCAAAIGGQILAAEIVRMMVGRSATQSFVPVGPLALKGIPEPVDAVEVLWEPAAVAGSIAVPARLVGAASDALFGFFGRAPELDALQEARKLAHATRRCQIVFVAGEAGIGKTALVAQVARAAHSEGGLVLFGHADEDLGVAYQPWIEVFKALVRDGDPASVAGLPSAQRAALGRLVPDVGSDDARVADPDMERMLLLEATSELLGAASRHASVLVVLDDLHWVDAASVQLLRHTAASTTPMDVVLACTYRETDLHRGDPLNKLLADLHREANVTRLALAGLEDIEIVDLLAAAAGHDLDDAGVGLAHALRRETDGNPFFAGEVLRHLGESGGIVFGEDGHWTVAGDLDNLGLPRSVHDVVGRRVERLGDEALRVLCLAAVIGREFDISILAQVAEVEYDPLLDLIDTAVTAAVLVEGGTPERYRFAHALIQHSLYDELSPARRQRAHQRIAETIEAHATGGDVATLSELAHHWVAATRPSDLDKALGYVRRAGDAARDALAPDDAVRWYQQALDLVARQTQPDDYQRAELLSALGAVQRQAFQPEFRETLCEAAILAERLGADEVLVHAALGFSQLPGSQVGDEDAKRVLRAALDRIGTDPTPTRSQLLATLSGAHDAAAEWRERRDLALEAVDAARQAGDDATFVDVIDHTSTSLATPERRDQLLADIERALAISDRIGDPLLRSRIRYPMMWAQYQRANLAGADVALAEMETLTATVGLPEVHWQFTMFRTGRLLLAGHIDEAETVNERLLEIGTAGGITEALHTFGGLLYAIRSHQGRLDEIADVFLEFARDNPSVAALSSTVPLMLCELQRIEEARGRLADQFAAGFDYPYDAMWLVSMANLTDAAVTTADHAAARLLVERLAPFADHVISPAGVIVNGAVARPLARAAAFLGDYGRAEAWFAIAHDIHARLEAPFWTALGQLDHADLCLSRLGDGDAERARELTRTAAVTAVEYGFAGLTTRATAVG